MRPGSSREPQWCSNEDAAQYCGLTSEKRVTPVCWTSLSTAQLTARAWDQGKGLLPEPFGSPGATALAGSDDCLKQLGVPGGCFLDGSGKLAAIRQQRSIEHAGPLIRECGILAPEPDQIAMHPHDR